MSDGSLGRSTYVLCWVSVEPPLEGAKIPGAFHRFDNKHRGNVTRLLHVGNELPMELAMAVRSVSMFAPTLQCLMKMTLATRKYDNIVYTEGCVWNARSNENVIQKLEALFNGGKIFFLPRATYKSPLAAANLWAAILEKPWMERRTEEFRKKYKEDKERKLAESRKRAADEALSEAPPVQKARMEEFALLDYSEDKLEFPADLEAPQQAHVVTENDALKCKCGSQLIDPEELLLLTCANCFVEQGKVRAVTMNDPGTQDNASSAPNVVQKSNSYTDSAHGSPSTQVQSQLYTSNPMNVNESPKAPKKSSNTRETKKFYNCHKCKNPKADDGNKFCKSCHESFGRGRNRNSLVQRPPN